MPPQEVFLTPHHLGIAMEYVEGGDLAQWVQTHRIPEVRGTPIARANTLELVGVSRIRSSRPPQAQGFATMRESPITHP